MDHNQENRCDKSAADDAFKNQLRIISTGKKILRRVAQKNFIDEIKAQLRIPRAPTGFCFTLALSARIQKEFKSTSLSKIISQICIIVCF